MKFQLLILALALSLLSLTGCSTSSPRPVEPPQTDPVNPPEIPQIPRQKPSRSLSDCGALPERPTFSILEPGMQPRALAIYITDLHFYAVRCAEKNRNLIEYIYEE